MATCTFEGNADMYGLGIRLGFYLQWLQGILANVLFIREEILAVRFTLSAFISATFVALIVQTTRHALSAVDAYVVLLMCFGSYYFIVPTFFWRAVTLCSPRLDPTRWAVLSPSTTYKVFTALMVTATASFQIWFWVSGLQQMRSECPPYGFLFTKLSLNGSVLRIVNISFQAILLACAVSGPLYSLWSCNRYLEPEDIKIPQELGLFLQLLRSVVNLIVAVIVIVATEITISWNGVQGVHTLDSAGQLIPFFVGTVMFLHVLWVYFQGDPDSFVDTSDCFQVEHRFYVAALGPEDFNPLD